MSSQLFSGHKLDKIVLVRYEFDSFESRYVCVAVGPHSFREAETRVVADAVSVLRCQHEDLSQIRPESKGLPGVFFLAYFNDAFAVINESPLCDQA